MALVVPFIPRSDETVSVGSRGMKRSRSGSFAIAGTVLVFIAIAPILGACNPTAEHPSTGAVTLEFISSSRSDIRFQLINNTTQVISFRGTQTRSLSASPWDTVMQCKADQSDVWIEGPYSLVDGGPQEVSISPGDQVELVVTSQFQREFVERNRGGRCRMTLRLQDGSFVESSEFRA